MPGLRVKGNHRSSMHFSRLGSSRSMIPALRCLQLATAEVARLLTRAPAVLFCSLPELCGRHERGEAAERLSLATGAARVP